MKMNSVLTAFIALGISFAAGVLLCPAAIPLLHKMKFGQYVRSEGPESHLKKSGTPTMGGIVILIAFIAGCAPFCGSFKGVWPVLIFTAAFGVIGLTDDALKLKKHQSEGLKSWQKMALQIVAAAALIIYTALYTRAGTYLIIPFAGGFDAGGWFYPIAAVAVLGTVNGANFTDGLDGLAGSVTSVLAVFIASCAILMKYPITPAALSMLGALLAFLCFNSYPAKVFMGDTGSLALGGFVAACALMMQIPLFLIIAAFVYLFEILSVIMQVSYFKLTHGKRIFKMTPVHHHFELCGWSETRVVNVFTITTFLLCVAAFAGLVIAL